MIIIDFNRILVCGAHGRIERTLVFRSGMTPDTGKTAQRAFPHIQVAVDTFFVQCFGNKLSGLFIFLDDCLDYIGR